MMKKREKMIRKMWIKKMLKTMKTYFGSVIQLKEEVECLHLIILVLTSEEENIRWFHISRRDILLTKQTILKDQIFNIRWK